MKTQEAFPDGLLECAVEVGAVTDRSVRLWLRQPGTSVVSGKLSIDNENAVTATTHLSEDSDWTGALQFDLAEPAPNARFRVDLADQTRTGALAPSPGQRTGLTFGFGSCNCPFKIEEGEIVYHQAAGIYDAFAEDLARARGSFVVLAGDQIYSDELEPISVRANYRDHDNWLPTIEETIEAYRLISRGYLGVGGFQRLRQRFPTLTIWDDHDIFDNWGSRKRVSALDQRMFEGATRAYQEYQHGRNPGGYGEQPPFHYSFSHGDIGFFVLDIRGK